MKSRTHWMKISDKLKTATLQIFTSYGIWERGATVGNNGYNSLHRLGMAKNMWFSKWQRQHFSPIKLKSCAAVVASKFWAYFHATKS